MSRYSSHPNIEAEYESNTHKRILKNKFGIKKVLDIQRIEYEALIEAQTKYYTKIVSKDTKITTEFIREMHKDWLGNIYEWAGNYRTVDMEKDGFKWPPAYLIKENMTRFEKDFLSVHTPVSYTHLLM